MGFFERFKSAQKPNPPFLSGAADNAQSDARLLEISEHRVWYRGDAGELSEFFGAMSRENPADSSRFWRKSSGAPNVRKVHSGLPYLMADKLAQIVTSDLSRITFDSERGLSSEIWRQIAAENNFDLLLYRAVSDILVAGDGAFKLSADTSLSRFPIIEWIPSEQASYEYARGRLLAVTFTSRHDEYILTERYEGGRVSAKLFHKEKEVSLDSLPETRGLAPGVEYPGGFIMALPCMFAQHPLYRHRGAGIYHTKGFLFDSLDEVLSGWLDAVRAGRVKTYIPESLLPRNPLTGRVRGRGAFDDAVIIADDMSEGAQNSIRTEQARIDYLAFQTSYNTCIDACLQGVLSPASLGIDVKKLDNAESQREKEKTTVSTRNKITQALSVIIPRLVECALKTYDVMRGETPKNYQAAVRFKGYANPSFEAMVDTVSKAAANNILSEERIVEYLYAESMGAEEKARETERLRQLRGKDRR